MAGLGSLMEPIVLFGAHGAGDRCLVCVCGGVQTPLGAWAPCCVSPTTSLLSALTLSKALALPGLHELPPNVVPMGQSLGVLEKCPGDRAAS